MLLITVPTCQTEVFRDQYIYNSSDISNICPEMVYGSINCDDQNGVVRHQCRSDNPGIPLSKSQSSLYDVNCPARSSTSAVAMVKRLRGSKN